MNTSSESSQCRFVSNQYGWSSVPCSCRGVGGDGKFKARGRLVKGETPFLVPEPEYVRITFHPIPPDGKPATHTYVAVYSNSDGHFMVVGADGRGLPPGKYRASVEHERKRKDLFQG